MSKSKRIPIALTIAGSDSGGGAGVQADLKTFAALGVHGTSAITCLTAQNPRGVIGIHAAPPKFVRAQMESVFNELRPAAAKTGMLYSKAIIQEVADAFAQTATLLVVDPVMVATSGAQLLKPGAINVLKKSLLPLAALVTPNLDEAALLTGRALKEPEDLRSAARQLFEEFGCAALIKGGHLKEMKEAIDVLYDGEEEWLFTAPFIANASTHGTGCVYSAAITAHLAKGDTLLEAIEGAKGFVTRAIKHSHQAGGHQVLNCWNG